MPNLSEADAVFHGSTPVTAIYARNALIWPPDGPVEPPPKFKVLLNHVIIVDEISGVWSRTHEWDFATDNQGWQEYDGIGNIVGPAQWQDGGLLISNNEAASGAVEYSPWIRCPAIPPLDPLRRYIALAIATVTQTTDGAYIRAVLEMWTGSEHNYGSQNIYLVGVPMAIVVGMLTPPPLTDPSFVQLQCNI